MRGFVNWLLVACFYATSVAIGGVLWGSASAAWALALAVPLLVLWWAIERRMR